MSRGETAAANWKRMMNIDEHAERLAVHLRGRPREAIVASFVIEYVRSRLLVRELNREITRLANALEKEQKRLGRPRGPYPTIWPDGTPALTDNPRIAAVIQYVWAAWNLMLSREESGQSGEFEALMAVTAMHFGIRAANGDNSNRDDVARSLVRVLELLDLPDREITRAIVIAQLILLEVDPRAVHGIVADLMHDPFRKPFSRRHESQGTPAATPQELLDQYLRSGSREARRVEELVEARHESVMKQRRRWQTPRAAEKDPRRCP